MPLSAPHHLPTPESDALAASAQLVARIGQQIRSAGGWIPFSEFMRQALYEPELGYYTGGSHKFGATGDFITAPEISDLFGQALAAQVSEIMRATVPFVTEFGAGSGRLALTVLERLAHLEALPERYQIVDVSGELRARQRLLFEQLDSEIQNRIHWLDDFPEQIAGAVVANELLDALPAEIVTRTEDGWSVRGVTLSEEGSLQFSDRPATGRLGASVRERIPDADSLQPGYTTELNPTAEGFVKTVLERMTRGAVLFIDYGFPAREFYHPQRNTGSMMAHYRHRAHTDYLLWPGLQDLTAHVDFTALATVGSQAGGDLLGYTSQAHFLMNCGIAALPAPAPENVPAWIRYSTALQRLLSEAEMGELFKVLALGRGIATPLRGFSRGDRSAAL